uniref:Uncharacterized protein n=1 Tax=Macaca mulatta TaxID=9544 RepID=A0A5F8A8X8_MACMU
MCHHARLIFVFLAEMGFCHDGLAGLKLLTSDDPPFSASQSAGITGVSHHAWPLYFRNKLAFTLWTHPEFFPVQDPRTLLRSGLGPLFSDNILRINYLIKSIHQGLWTQA